MSVLQKILQEMYVAPDLLAELGDEQKQVLFCKMREEQMRRWTAYEKELENDKLNGSNQAEPKVRWLLASDGQPWVWVMGEHSTDQSIDEILEQETLEKARRLAEQEAQELQRSKEEEELKAKLREEQLEAERDRLKVERERQLAAQEETTVVRRRTEEQKKKNKIESDRKDTFRAHEALLKRELEQQRLWQDSIDKDTELENRLLNEAAEQAIERRRSEIYQTLTEARQKANIEADKEAEEERRYWEEQENKARLAEEQIRTIARKAREQHRQHGLRTSTPLLNVAPGKTPPKKPLKHGDVDSVTLDSSNDSGSPVGFDNSRNNSTQNVLTLPRPPKPSSRDAIIQWYLKEELPSGSGLDPVTNQFAPWFHGIIGRQDAEQLLMPPRQSGAFLVRISERIWGYAVSYCVDGAGRIKHFLIEKVPDGGYQFLGVDQVVHASLWDLITYHQKFPLTSKGREILREPVGQSRSPPDYQELLSFALAGNSIDGSGSTILASGNALLMKSAFSKPPGNVSNNSMTMFSKKF